MYIYEIRVQGLLDKRWTEWFDGLTITYDSDENTVLRGSLVDEAALHGVLIKVRDLALPLLAVNRVADRRAELESHEAKPETGDLVEQTKRSVKNYRS
jgi:hypothetical protein